MSKSKMLKDYMLKTLTSGNLVIKTLYPYVKRNDSVSTRALKHKLSTAAQQKLNRTHRVNGLALLIAGNFKPYKSMLITLTFDKEHEEEARSEKAAKHSVTLFVKKLSRSVQKDIAAGNLRSEGLEYIKAFEAGEASSRWHCHMVINLPLVYAKKLVELWSYGNIDIKPLEEDNCTESVNSFALAEYLTKSSREYGTPAGRRSYSCSKNLKRPQITTRRVTSSYTLTCPAGCTLTMSGKVSKTIVGEYCNYKYETISYFTKKIRRVKPKKTKRQQRTRKQTEVRMNC